MTTEEEEEEEGDDDAQEDKDDITTHMVQAYCTKVPAIFASYQHAKSNKGNTHGIPRTVTVTVAVDTSPLASVIR